MGKIDVPLLSRVYGKDLEFFEMLKQYGLGSSDMTFYEGRQYVIIDMSLNVACDLAPLPNPCYPSQNSDKPKNGAISIYKYSSPRCPHCSIEITFGCQLKPWFCRAGIACLLNTCPWTYYRRPP